MLPFKPTSSHCLPPLDITMPYLPTHGHDENTINLIRNWIRSRPNLSQKKQFTPRFASEITIPVYKQLKRHCHAKIEETNIQIIALKRDMHTISRELWCLKKEEIDCNLAKINEITSAISHPKIIKGIRQRIHKSNSKRAKFGRLHPQNVGIIGNERTIEAESKLHESHDKSLSDEERKIEEIHNLLSGMVKLRNMRNIKSVETESYDSSTFDEKVKEFKVKLAAQKELFRPDMT
ncbi:hypothetical protein LOD99_2886 [Oopsacas minuta]|uniref:Uncharacterized protein n=1 Tax=Oopsacas minuta TaxID=111878 RepID=A0AAV7JZZ5_9METZ|nr:hypothetical protein LOD99_2886 [Oopsacas minuta]